MKLSEDDVMIIYSAQYVMSDSSAHHEIFSEFLIADMISNYLFRKLQEADNLARIRSKMAKSLTTDDPWPLLNTPLWNSYLHSLLEDLWDSGCIGHRKDLGRIAIIAPILAHGITPPPPTRRETLDRLVIPPTSD